MSSVPFGVCWCLSSSWFMEGLFPQHLGATCSWLLWNSHMDQMESGPLQSPVSDLSHVGAAAEHGRSSGLSTCDCSVPTDLPLPEARLWFSVFEGFSFSRLLQVSQLSACFPPQPSCFFSPSFPHCPSLPFHCPSQHPNSSPSSFCSPLFPGQELAGVTRATHHG